MDERGTNRIREGRRLQSGCLGVRFCFGFGVYVGGSHRALHGI